MDPVMEGDCKDLVNPDSPTSMMEIVSGPFYGPVDQPKCSLCSAPTDISCCNCEKPYHLACIPLLRLWKTQPLPGDLLYAYNCCEEKIERLNVEWKDVIAISLFNSLGSCNITEDDYGRKYIPLQEIYDFIESNYLMFKPRKSSCWRDMVKSVLSDKWFCTIGGGLYALEEFDHPAKLEDQGVRFVRYSITQEGDLEDDGVEDDDEGYMKRRRKSELDFEERKRRRNDDENSDPSLVLTMYYDIDNNNDEPVKISRQPTHSAPQVSISPDGLTVTNQKGYRMAKASHGVWEGHWYYEFILDNDKGNVRLGWSQISGDLQAPCGYDVFSYSYRANPGTLFHNSKKVEMPILYDAGFKKGDIMGCYIHLGKYKRKQKDPNVDPILLKRLWDPDKLHYAPFKSKPLPTMSKSYIEFFKNGYSLGRAFVNLGLGKYYPAVSLYNNASGTMNFGPDFIYPPLNDAYGMYRVYELDTWEETLEKFRKANEEVERLKRDTKMKKLGDSTVDLGNSNDALDSIDSVVVEMEN